MVPSGPPTPVGGSQSVPPSHMQTNSGMLGAQGGPVPSQTGFPSLVSPRTQFNNVNMLGNIPNASSLLNQSYVNGGPNPGIQGTTGNRGGISSEADSDSFSSIGNGMGFNTLTSFVQSNMINPGSVGLVQGQQFTSPSGNQLIPDQQHSQQLEPQNFQHGHQVMQQLSAFHNAHQQQFQAIRGGVGGVGPVKLEQQVNNDHQGPPHQQQLQSLRNFAPVKLEPQQMPSRSLAPVKMESQESDQSLFLHQQHQQQQQYLQMSRQSPQAAARLNFLHQQRLLHMQQQQQQQQLLKAIPQQQSQLQQQFQQKNLPLRSPAKPLYEPGMCARRLTLYMYQQQHRPEDNNIEFWRKFVTEYFASHAKKRWCVSMYGSGRQTTGVFPQDVWHCEICNRKPGRGFEATVEVLPRLFKIKYESGTLEELLYVDMPREYQNSSGQIVLDYAKAIQESVFEQLRVVRDGQLRLVFNSDLKICSWEFCARRHEELIPRRLLIPQVSQLGAAAQKYQACAQNVSSNLSVPELQSNCNMFVASARQMAKALEVPLVNDLGYTKRYVRCLQISEVVNSMKDLIDYSRETGIGPMESLAKFPRRTNASSGIQNPAQQPQEQLQQQQTLAQNSSSNQTSLPANPMQLAAGAGNGVMNVNNSLNATSASTSVSTITGLFHQNSMNSRQETPMNNSSSSYGGSRVQILSPSSSHTIPSAQPNSSPFQSPTPTLSNNPLASHGALTTANHTSSTNSQGNTPIQQPAVSSESDPSDSQSSVQKIIHEMMMSGQTNGASGMANGGTLGNDLKNINRILPTKNGMSNGGNSGIGGANFGTMNGGVGQSTAANGIRAALTNNLVTNGRVSMSSTREPSLSHQQDIGNQLLSGLGAMNDFSNLQFDWKSSP